MRKVAIITADWNDADYVTQETDITDDPEAEAIVRAIAAINKSKPRHAARNIHQHPDLKKYHPDSIFDIIPCGPDGAEVHSFRSIRILTILNEESL